MDWSQEGLGEGRQPGQTFQSRTLPAASILPPASPLLQPPWPGSSVGSLWAAGALVLLTAACQLVP